MLPLANFIPLLTKLAPTIGAMLGGALPALRWVLLGAVVALVAVPVGKLWLEVRELRGQLAAVSLEKLQCAGDAAQFKAQALEASAVAADHAQKAVEAVKPRAAALARNAQAAQATTRATETPNTVDAIAERGKARAPVFAELWNE